MQYITVTGRVTSKVFLVPTDNIHYIVEAEGGADIHLKRNLDGSKIKKIECSEPLLEIRKDLNSLQ